MIWVKLLKSSLFLSLNKNQQKFEISLSHASPWPSYKLVEKNTMCHVPWDSGSTSQSPWKWTCWSPVASIKNPWICFGVSVVVEGEDRFQVREMMFWTTLFSESWWHWRLGFFCRYYRSTKLAQLGWYWMVLDVLNVDSKLKLLLPCVKPYNMILDRFSRLIQKISVLKGKLFDEVNCTSFTHWEYRLTLTCKRVEQELFDWNLWFEFTMEEVGFWPVDDFTDCSFRGVLTLYMQQSVDISR